MTKTIVIIIAVFLGSFSTGMAQKKRVIIKYKKYEKIDLGKLSVDGDFSSPTDIFIRKESQAKIKQKFYVRKKFRKEVYSDILELR